MAQELNCKKIAQYRSKAAFISYTCCQCIVRAIGLIIPYLTESLIDSVSQQDQQTLLKYSVIVFGAVLVYVAFLTAAFYIKACYENSWIIDKKRSYLEKMQQLPLEQLQEKGSGYYLQRFSTNIEGCRNFIIDKPVNFYLNFIYGAGIIISMLRINIKYALTLLISFPILAILYRYLAQKVRLVTTQIEELDETASSLMEEVYSCNYAIRTSNAEAWYMDRAEKILTNIFQKNREYSRIESIYDYFLITGLLNIVSILVYSIGGQLALWGSISYGMIISMSLYYSKLWSPLEFYLDYPKQRAKYRVHHDRINEVLDYKTIYGDRKDIGAFDKLELCSVSYAVGTTYIFDQLSFLLNKGEHISISGSNGSGKTTLANLIAAISNGYSGTIFYNELDYRHLDPRSIRRHICLIPAKPELFSGSIQENIRMGDERQIPKVVKEILNQKELPLDLVIQENGTNISSGEAKLVQLLRGVCRNCDVYIIDEPLNYIDDKYAEIVISALEELFDKKTVIIISHDRRIFRMCSKHYVIDNRKLIQM